MKVRLLISERTAFPVVADLTMQDRTSVLLEQEWEISQHTGSTIDTLTFVLDDPSNTLNIEQGQDVIIEHFTNPSIRYFGGITTDVDIVSVGIGRQLHMVAQDYTILADRSTVRKVYVLDSDRAIIQDAFKETALPGVQEVNTSRFVNKLRDTLTLRFQGSTLRSILDTISEITGATWYIDPFKFLHYHKKTSNSLGFGFSDASDDSATFPFYNLRVFKQLGEWNVVELQGGKDVSDDIDDEVYSGDGSTTVFITGEQAGTNPIDRAPSTGTIIEIDRNTNTNASPTWTAQDVAHESDDDKASADVIWNPGNRRVERATAPPNFVNSWRITGRYLIDVIVQAADTNAIARVGRIFKGSLTIPEAATIAQAQDLAMAWLQEHSDRILVRFNTNKDDVELDKTVGITSSIHGLSAENGYIYGLTIHLLGAEVAEYTVEVEVLNNLIFAA